MSIIYEGLRCQNLLWIICGLVIGQIIKLTFFYFCAPLLLLVAQSYFEPFLLKWVLELVAQGLLWVNMSKEDLFNNNYISFRFLIYKDDAVILLLKPYL